MVRPSSKVIMLHSVLAVVLQMRKIFYHLKVNVAISISANLHNLQNSLNERWINFLAQATDFDISEHDLSVELREIFMAFNFVALNQ